MGAEPDLLASAAWECAPTWPGEASAPDGLAELPLRWLPASVPGTAAAALRDAGLPEPTHRRARRPRLVVPVPGPLGGVGRRSLRAPPRRTGDRRGRLARRAPPGTLRVDVRPAPGAGGGVSRRQRALHPVCRARPAARGAPSAAAMEVPFGDRAEPALVPHHPARASVRVDGDARPGRTVAAGPSRAFRSDRPARAAGRRRVRRGRRRHGLALPRASPASSRLARSPSRWAIPRSSSRCARSRATGSPRDGSCSNGSSAGGRTPTAPNPSRRSPPGSPARRSTSARSGSARSRWTPPGTGSGSSSTACRSSAGVPAGTRRTRSLC